MTERVGGDTVRRGLCAGAVVVLLALAAHFPATQAGFIWDDDGLLTDNSLIRVDDGLYRFWFTSQATDYFPLTYTMFWVEWRIWGKNPLPYHVVNVLLHAAAAVLLWRVLLKLRVPGALLAAAIFAVHPVTVESVAWISERKNTLSMVLCLLSMLLYLQFDEEGRSPREAHRRYAAALLLFLAALFAKPSVVMLPLVFLLFAWWQRGRIGRSELIRTGPFFLAALLLGLVTVWFQHRDMSLQVPSSDLASRVVASGYALWFYLGKIVAPVHLAMIYPQWAVNSSDLLSFVPLGLMAACVLVLWWKRDAWGRGPLAAVGCFIIVLIPVLGLVKMAYMQHSLVADHLQYAAMPAIIALFAAVATTAASRLNVGHVPRTVAAAVLLCVLSVLTWRQAALYENPGTLWRHTIALNDRAWAAMANLGIWYRDQGKPTEAIEQFSRAIAANPKSGMAHNGRGFVYKSIGRTDDALRDYTKAVEVDPKCAEAFNNAGLIYSDRGETELALRNLARAIEVRPLYAVAYYNRACLYQAQQRYDLAVQDYSTAIELNPAYADAHNNRGAIYQKLGRTDLAIEDYGRVIRLRPDFAAPYWNRANCLRALGRLDEAGRDYDKAIELQGSVSEFYNSRGVLRAAQKEWDRAVADFTKAIELKPGDAALYRNRAGAYAEKREYGKAWEDVKACERLGGTVAPGFVDAIKKALPADKDSPK